MTLIEVSRITDVVDHLDIAESTAKALLSNPSITPIVAMYAKAGLALLAVHTDNQSEAAEHYAYFLRHQGTMIWTLVSADRLLGLLAQTVGDLEQAAAHFEDALAFCRKAGYRPELAWSCHDYAGALLQRSDPGDHTNAASLLTESLAISSELGMRPLMERVAALQEQLLAEAEPTPAYPDGLSNREVEVLKLVAAGKSNSEIAQELFISANTVAHHVTNILNKTNSSNRTEAATYAAQHGLTQRSN
jgi:DNA-binding CsgD family transcriptional regulator